MAEKENPPITAQEIDPRQEDLVRQKLDMENRFKSGANWFFWIAGLSVINTIVSFSGGSLNFIVGLGVTQVFDVLVRKIAGANAAIASLGVNILVSGVFALFGFYSRRGKPWAFIIGMVLYTLDGLLFLFVKDFIAAGFHAFALFFIYNGYKTLREQMREVPTL